MDSMPTGRITLLGDAAHAMTPCKYQPPFRPRPVIPLTKVHPTKTDCENIKVRGEGGFHAITDALNLARAIGKIDKNDGVEKIKALFGPYQDEMLARGKEAARLSEENFAKKRQVGSEEFYYGWGRRMAPLPDEE